MRKFNLFSRTALAALVAGEVPEDSEAGPEPVTPAPSPAPTPEPAPAPTPPAPPAPDNGGQENGGEPSDPPPEVPAPASVAAPANGSATAADELAVCSVADARALSLEQFAAGRKAERERTAAVMGSPEGKAAPAMAAFMLAHNPEATGAAIIAGLKEVPAGGRAAASPIGNTGINLGRASGGEEDTRAEGDRMWDAELERTKPKSAVAAAPVVPDGAAYAGAGTIPGAGYIPTGN
jgi:hypothetical protein